MDFADKDKREDWIKNKHMRAFNLVNPNQPLSEIDIIIDTPIDYKMTLKNVNYITTKNITIPIISIDDLIRMKEKTGRRQDKTDIRYLRGIKKEI
ncbi:MAG: hypothetical protein NC904_08860 [Candidatus Omnitrophica bacterium]|nr:hypothetical protein [Candidatus Omnitrophota bacterium]